MAIKVHQFDPVLYPRKIWIVKGYGLTKQIKEHFISADGEPLNVDYESDCYACVWGMVRYKDVDKLGVLIWLQPKFNFESCAHEAVHVVNKIFTDCCVDYGQTHDEHFAYFVGKVSYWMYQVWTGKFKD